MPNRNRNNGTQAILALSLTVAACATPGQSPAGSGVGVPIAVNSVGSSYGIQRRLDGTAVVRDGWVHVTASRGLARTYQGETSIWDLLLRARLATCTGGEWEVASDSRALRVAPAVGLERDAAILDTAGRAFAEVRCRD